MAVAKRKKDHPDDHQRGDVGWHPSKGEQYRALYDFLKHIATLSAGSILLIATMLEKMFAQPKGRSWVTGAVSAFLLTLAISAIGFMITAVQFPRQGKPPLTVAEQNVFAVSIVLTCFGFVAGIASIAIFFWINWQEIAR